MSLLYFEVVSLPHPHPMWSFRETVKHDYPAVFLTDLMLFYNLFFFSIFSFSLIHIFGHLKIMF